MTGALHTQQRQETSGSGAPGPGRVLLLASGVTFLAFLDATVVNVAFPDLRRSFPQVSLAQLTWVVTAYGVLLAALLAAAGRLADVLGRRRLFLGSVLGFTLASLAAAAAPAAGLLIAARALQGASAAGMIPAALGLVLAHTPPERRAAAIGTWGAAGGMAAAVGPSLGGVLVEVWSWRGIFLVNVPLGLLIAYGTLRTLRPDTPTGRRLPDPLGAASLALGIGALVAGLSQGSGWGWGSARVGGLLAGGVLFTALALRRSRRHPAPAVEWELWRSRAFAATNATSLFFGAAMYAWLLSGPLFLTTFWHYSILKSGLAVTPGAFTAALGSLVVGRRVPPHRQWAVILGGSLLFAGTCAAMWAWAGPAPSFAGLWLPAGLVGGLATGMVLTALSTAASAALPAPRFAAGTGLLMTARQVGGALGVAAMAAILAAAGGPAGPADTEGYLAVFLFCGAAALVSAAVSLAVRRPSRQPS